MMSSIPVGVSSIQVGVSSILVGVSSILVGMSRIRHETMNIQAGGILVFMIKVSMVKLKFRKIVEFRAPPSQRSILAKTLKI